jgi:uncharacterized protein YrrD
MLITKSNMLGTSVMSLQTGQPLAQISGAVINPHNLKILAFYVHGPLVDFDPAVLFPEDIRELGQLGAIVDGVENIMSPDGLVRLEEVIGYNFVLDNIWVVDDRGRKLGRVENYAFDSDSFMIQQLYLKPTLLRQFSVASLTIGRSQIVSIDNHRIVVKAPTETVPKSAAAPAEPRAMQFDNPFRKPKTALNSAEQKS